MNAMGPGLAALVGGALGVVLVVGVLLAIPQFRSRLRRTEPMVLVAIVLGLGSLVGLAAGNSRAPTSPWPWTAYVVTLAGATFLGLSFFAVFLDRRYPEIGARRRQGSMTSSDYTPLLTFIFVGLWALLCVVALGGAWLLLGR